MDAITLFSLLVKTLKSYSFCCCADGEEKLVFKAIIKIKQNNFPVAEKKSGPIMTSVGGR